MGDLGLGMDTEIEIEVIGCGSKGMDDEPVVVESFDWEKYCFDENPDVGASLDYDQMGLGLHLRGVKNRYPTAKSFKKVACLDTMRDTQHLFLEYAVKNNYNIMDVVLDDQIFTNQNNTYPEKPYYYSFAITGKLFTAVYTRNRVTGNTWFFLFFDDYSFIKNTFFAKDQRKYAPGIYELGKDERGSYILNKVSIDYLDKPILDKKMSELLHSDIKSFFKNKKFYEENNLPRKRGLIFYGPHGCHAKDTQVILFNGSLKKVQDVVVGDILMGPDSKPREVLKLVRGKEQMYRIIPNKGESFEVNESHILSLKPSRKNDTFQFDIEISLKDYLRQTKPFKDRMLLHKVPLDFPAKDLKIPPYILGLWLGDGSSDRFALTTEDKEIFGVWSKYIESENLAISSHRRRKNSKAETHIAVIPEKEDTTQNKLVKLLKNYGLVKNKHIPLDYLTGSKKQRLELLAGLIDSDGYVNGYSASSGKGRSLEITLKSEKLSKDILFLVRSLGFAAYSNKCTEGCYIDKKKVFEGEYIRTSINGMLDTIPVLLSHKVCGERKQRKDVLRVGFTYQKTSLSDYYGFVIDEDHLYVTGDFIVHHNCGKTTYIKDTLSKYEKTYRLLVDCGEHFSHELYKFLQEVFPKDGQKIIVFEDVESIGMGGDGRSYAKRSSFLNFIDGPKTMDNTLFLATTNHPDLVDKALIDRPSRFDKIYKIDLPSEECRRLHLAKWFPKLTKDELETFSLKTKDFSGAYFKELFILVGSQDMSLDEAVTSIKSQIRVIQKNNFDEHKPLGLNS